MMSYTQWDSTVWLTKLAFYRFESCRGKDFYSWIMYSFYDVFFSISLIQAFCLRPSDFYCLETKALTFIHFQLVANIFRKMLPFSFSFLLFYLSWKIEERKFVTYGVSTAILQSEKTSKNKTFKKKFCEEL